MTQKRKQEQPILQKNSKNYAEMFFPWFHSSLLEYSERCNEVQKTFDTNVLHVTHVS